MSRIHEALKKAEEEKRATRTGDGDLASPSPAAEPDPLALAAPPLTKPEVAATVAREGRPAAVDYPTLLARCPEKRWSPDLSHMLFFSKNHRDSVGVEEFRTLRSRLYQIREKRPLKTVMIGSALPGEGKSFVAANLAQVLVRQHGRRVLLIDGDLRKPHLHECLGTSAEPGLADYLRGDCDEFAVLQRGPMESLFLIPGGRPAPNPAELVANGRLKTLIECLGPVFDWIVIDSPPAVPVSDPAVMAGVCDGVLLVVEAANTPYDMAQRARQEFRHAHLLGVVLNRVPKSGTYTSYYYYDRYGGHSKKPVGARTATES